MEISLEIAHIAPAEVLMSIAINPEIKKWTNRYAETLLSTHPARALSGLNCLNYRAFRPIIAVPCHAFWDKIPPQLIALLVPIL